MNYYILWAPKGPGLDNENIKVVAVITASNTPDMIKQLREMVPAINAKHGEGGLVKITVQQAPWQSCELSPDYERVNYPDNNRSDH